MKTPSTLGPSTEEIGERASSQPSTDRSRVRADTRLSLLAHGTSLLVPLLTVPYLARVLGRDGWGELLVMQSLAAWAMLALDFGFDLSATRSAAAARDDARGLDRIVSGVQTAKLLVLGAASVIAVALMLILHPALSDYRMLSWTISFAVARGLNPFWYFQGTGQLRFALVVETFTKISAAVSVFVLVLLPGDAWRVLQLQALGAIASLTLLSAALVRARPAGRLVLTEGWASLRATFSLFAFRLSSGLYNQANASLMGRVAVQSSVSMFGGPERLVRSVLNLLQPITLVFMPRVSHLHAKDPQRAHQEIRKLLVVLGGVGTVFGLSLAVAAPWVVQTMLGPGYEDAIPVLRILALLPPTTAVGTVFGMYWAVPFGRERAFLAAVMAAGVCNLAMVPIIVPRFGAPGMAVSAVTAELIVAVSLAVLYVRDRARRLVPQERP